MRGKDKISSQTVRIYRITPAYAGKRFTVKQIA